MRVERCGYCCLLCKDGTAKRCCKAIYRYFVHKYSVMQEILHVSIYPRHGLLASSVIYTDTLPRPLMTRAMSE